MRGDPSSGSQLAREYLSGSCASSTTAAIFCPLECVKVRLQVQDMPGWHRVYHNGFGDAAMDILKSDGLLRFWSYGFSASVTRDFVYSGVRTGMYPTVRDALASNRAAGEASLLPSLGSSLVQRL